MSMSVNEKRKFKLQANLPKKKVSTQQLTISLKMFKIVSLLFWSTAVLSTAASRSKHHFCVDERSGCTLSVNIRCRIDATGESCLNAVCDPNADGFSYEKCINPIETKYQHFMTTNQEKCGSMPVTLRYKVCNRNEFPIHIDAERTKIMFQREEVQIPKWKRVIFGESCRLIKLKRVYDTCKKVRTTSMEIEANLQFDESQIYENNRCSCFIKNKAKINIIRPDPEPTPCTSREIFFTEFADPQDGIGGRYMEIYAPECAGKEIIDRIKILRYPEGSSAPSEKYISLKNRIVPADGFIVICNTEKVNNWNGQVCDDIGSWIGAEPYANDTFAIVMARFDGEFRDLDIIDVYGDTSSEREGQDLSGGRAFRSLDPNLPSEFWDRNAWDISSNDGTFATTKDADPRQWNPSPPIVEPQESKPVNQKLSLRRLPFFDESVLSPYTSCTDLRSDMLEAFEVLTNITIDVEARRKFHDDFYGCHTHRGGRFGGCVMMMAEEGRPVAMARGSSTTSSPGKGESSFQTNNQVKGVDEADKVKSDGTHVFVAYGNQLITFNALTGEELSTTIMPTDDELGVKLCTELRKEEFADGMNCYETKYWTRIEIEGLLLHDDRLFVITSASGYVPRVSNTKTILDQNSLTRTFVYDISETNIPRDGKSLKLVQRKDLPGRYQTGRAIGQYAHVVTKSSIDTGRHLNSELSAWNKEFEGMDEVNYRAKAYELSLAFGPGFVDMLMEELEEFDGLTDDICSQFVKIAIMTRSQAREFILPSFTEISVLDSLTQLHSLDLLDDQTDVNTSNGSSEGDATMPSNAIPLTKTSTSAAFFPSPSYTTNVYASADKLVVAGESYVQDAKGRWNEHTALMVFDLINGTSVPRAVGDVPGKLLNQFSMDHYFDEDTNEDYLRVATTSWARWRWANIFWNQTESSESQVSILNIPKKVNHSISPHRTMVMVGNVTGIGKTERIYAARFIGDKAYIVTFRQTDPFYTLDLRDPYNPKLAGELKIPGFSNYLHKIDDDLILGVGQMADDTGRTSGLQISLFDVSNFTNPRRVRTYTEGSMSNSNAQYEHKAFRYLPESKLLILPLYVPRRRVPIPFPEMPRSTSSSKFFDGFAVYDVDETKDDFSKRFQISHIEEDELGRYCWSRHNLPSRSLVFNGTVVTMKRHSVMKHLLDLNDGQIDFASAMDMTTIDNWLEMNGLNEYGDPMDTMYVGGNPLFDETTGIDTPRIVHLLDKFPSRPWDTDMTIINEWLIINGLNMYGDPMDTTYMGGNPLFNETTGEFTPRNEYLLKKFPSTPWDVDMTVVDDWLTKNGLNEYGDPMDITYMGGNPLFNQTTGTTTPQILYLLEKFPSRPWDIDMVVIDMWLMKNSLNEFGDPIDTKYMGSTPLFDETTGMSTPRILYLLKKFPLRPWDIDMTVIDVWLRRNNLNTYGDGVDTTYMTMGGDPLFNETSGDTTPRIVYLLNKFPSKPWGIDMSIIDEWLAKNNLNKYGDPMDTMYAGGSPLFNERTGENTPRIVYLLDKYPSRPWGSVQMNVHASKSDASVNGYGPLWKITLDNDRSVEDNTRCWEWF